MKRIGVSFLILGLVLSCGKTPMAQEETDAQQEEPSFEIVDLSGKVMVRFSGEEEYEPAEEDMFLRAGDQMYTGEDSHVELVYDEDGNNVVRMDSNAFCVFKLEESEKLEFFNGELLSTINDLPAGSSFEIRTPAAVCGARGTDWVTKVSGEGTDIEAVDGSPYVKGINQDGTLMAEKIVIPPGRMTRVQRFERPSKPVRLSRRRLKKLDDLRKKVRKRARDVIRKRKTRPGFKYRRDRMKQSFKRRLEKKKDRPKERPKDMKSRPKKFKDRLKKMPKKPKEIKRGHYKPKGKALSKPKRKRGKPQFKKKKGPAPKRKTGTAKRGFRKKNQPKKGRTGSVRKR